MNRDQAIRLAHVARRDLQIDEAAWRELLMGKFRVESSKDLSLTQLYTLVEHLKKCGFKVRHRTRPASGGAGKPAVRGTERNKRVGSSVTDRSAAARAVSAPSGGSERSERVGSFLSRPLAGAAQETPGDCAKIRALWLFLHHDLGIVKDPSERALAAYVKRMTGVDALQWITARHAFRVIEGLKKWAERSFPAMLRERLDAFSTRARVPPSLASAVADALNRGTYDALLDAWRALDEVESPSAAGDRS